MNMPPSEGDGASVSAAPGEIDAEEAIELLLRGLRSSRRGLSSRGEPGLSGASNIQAAG